MWAVSGLYVLCLTRSGFSLDCYGLQAGELLLAGHILTADEAQRRGLISKLCWPEKYQETVKSTVAAVAQGSRQVISV